VDFVYICSPLRGDVEGNIKKAVEYSRFAYTKGKVPLAPHVIFTTFLDDTNENERKAGIKMGLKLLDVCDELWVFGDRVSEGMVAEIEKAKKLGLKIRKFNGRCERK